LCVLFTLGLALVAITFSTAAPLPVPPLHGRVNDLADVLSDSEESSLANFLASFEQQTSNQIAVLTVPTLAGESIEEYAIRVARAWKLGTGERNNGALLLVAPQERKVRIEVGYGLEGALTDAESKLIIANVIVPRFRDGDFGTGIRLGARAMAEATQGEYTALPQKTTRRRKSGSALTWILFLVFFGLSWLPLSFSEPVLSESAI